MEAVECRFNARGPGLIDFVMSPAIELKRVCGSELDGVALRFRTLQSRIRHKKWLPNCSNVVKFERWVSQMTPRHIPGRLI